MFKYKYSKKFYLGLIVLISSLIMGKVGQYFFFFRNESPNQRYLGLIIYLLSWPMTIVGVWWIGEEYADKIKKFVSYKFYRQSLKKGTRKVYDGTKIGTKKIYRGTKAGTKKVYWGTRIIGGHVKRKLQRKKQ